MSSGEKERKITSESSADGDRISGLPEPIIHHVMSFLPPGDATRVAALSKTWRDLWATFPILDFDQDSIDQALSDPEKRDLFLSSVRQAIQRLRERSRSIEKLKIHASNREKYTDGQFERTIELALESNVRELDLGFRSEENDGFYDLPVCLYSAKSVASLTLNGFELGLVDLLSGCHSIEELVLEKCRVWEGVVKISSEKLKKLWMEVEARTGVKSVEVDACNLRTFGYFGSEYSTEEHERVVPCNINLSASIFLRTLSLQNAKVPDQWLENLLTELFRLEDLSLKSCSGLTLVTIRHENLKTLCLLSCTMVKEVEIDAPKLCRFEFEGEMPHFKLMNSSGTLNATLTLLRGMTTLCYVKLRRLLGLFDHCKILKLNCYSYEDLVFPQLVREIMVPPLHDLKHLEIKIKPSSPPVDSARLVDNLLWLSPHLETLFLSSKTEESHLQFQYKKISEGKDENVLFSCCKAHPKECWQHSLNRVIITSSVNDLNDSEKLLQYFFENAKGLESIQDNSRNFKVVCGEDFNNFEKSMILL